MRVRNRLIVALLFSVSMLGAAQKTPPAAKMAPASHEGSGLAPSPLPIGTAAVGEVKGEVVIHASDGSAVRVLRGQQLAPGTIIETGKKSSIILELSDGSQVLVKPHSQVSLSNPQNSETQYLRMLIGKIIMKVQKRLGNAPSFRMGTPTAVITVRGTRFLVDVDHKGRTSVEVYEGLVEVMGAMPGGGFSPPVLLRPGFETEIDRERAPRTPRRINDLGEGLDGGRGDRDRFGNEPHGTEDRERPSGEGGQASPGDRDPG